MESYIAEQDVSVLQTHLSPLPVLRQSLSDSIIMENCSNMNDTVSVLKVSMADFMNLGNRERKGENGSIPDWLGCWRRENIKV